MNEKEANIDLLFRNGLKDFEVLPPPGVCESILSSVKIKSSPYIFLRIAAAITVLLTLSFLTYRWSREFSFGPSYPTVAFNVPVSLPVFSNPADNRQFLPEAVFNPVKNSSVVVAVKDNPSLIQKEIETGNSPEQIMNIQEIRSLTITKNETTDRLFLTPLNTFKGHSVKITYPDLQYSPENIITKPEKRWSIAAMASTRAA